MLIFLLVVIGLSVLILGHEAGHFAAAKLFGLKVDEFGFGFPPRIFAWRSRKKIERERGKKKETGKKELGETEYSLNWLPFGGFVKIAGESERGSDREDKLKSLPEEEKKRLLFFQPAWKKAVIVAAGVAVNFVLGWLLISAVLVVGLPTALVVSGVQPGSPAEAAGIQKNDLIRGFPDSKSFVNFVNENMGKEIMLDVRRGGKELAVAAVPRTNISPDQGALGVLFFEGGEAPQGPFTAIWEGFKRSLYVCGAVVVAIFNLLKNLLFRGSLLEGIVGPVGIFTVAYDAGGLGLVYLLQLVAMISLNLAVVNLIPFPALDGGRLLLIIVEKIKGSPIPRAAEAWVNAAGFAFLVFLMVLLTVRDVGGLF